MARLLWKQSDPNDATSHRDSAQNARVNHIQVRPKEEMDEETETKTVMKCGMNVKTNHHKIMPEQMILKPAVKQGDNNALKKVQLEHVIVEIQGKETEKGSIVKVNALPDSGAEIPVISEDELIEGMNLEPVGEVSLQCVAGEAIPAKLVEVKVRIICELPSDTIEETRTNQVKFTITPYVTLVCACIAGMGSKEKFLLYAEIIAELRAIPQVIIKHEEEVQAYLITRAQRLQELPRKQLITKM